jgi:Zn-dependent protease
MVAHEYAHGYAALRQGDPTAYQLGRLTWNPVRHIDPFMTVILPLILFFMHAPIIGGAKPVPVNPRNYRHYKRGDIIVSLAGVATNLVIALLCVPLIIVTGFIGQTVPVLAPSLALFQVMLAYGIVFNLVLVIFNLFPIPPLDGSHVVKHLLPPAWSWRYQQFGRYGFIVLILLLFYTPVFNWWLWPVTAGTRFLLAPTAAFHLSSSVVL